MIHSHTTQHSTRIGCLKKVTNTFKLIFYDVNIFGSGWCLVLVKGKTVHIKISIFCDVNRFGSDWCLVLFMWVSRLVSSMTWIGLVVVGVN